MQEVEFKGEFARLLLDRCSLLLFLYSVNDTFANLRKGVNQVEGFETAAFMWEWYTTKPFVDSGEVGAGADADARKLLV